MSAQTKSQLVASLLALHRSRNDELVKPFVASLELEIGHAQHLVSTLIAFSRGDATKNKGLLRQLEQIATILGYGHILASEYHLRLPLLYNALEIHGGAKYNVEERLQTISGDEYQVAGRIQVTIERLKRHVVANLKFVVDNLGDSEVLPAGPLGTIHGVKDKLLQILNQADFDETTKVREIWPSLEANVTAYDMMRWLWG